MKNLIYFIYYPGYIHHYHILNLEYLNRFWSTFDGVKIITIAVNKKNENITPLLQLLPKSEYNVVINDPVNWEAPHFINALHQVNEGMTFYAHCKGISRENKVGLNMWIRNLYIHNLTEPPILGKKIVSGICAKLLPCPPYVEVPWHYSGSFFWFDTKKAKARFKKLNPAPFRYLTESFPGLIASQKEADLRYFHTTENINFYRAWSWRQIEEKLLV